MSCKLNNFTVYMHINKENNKKYIGITQRNVEKRWQEGEGYAKQPLFYKAIKKYGWDNFEHKILLSNLTKETAFKMEIQFIKFYKSNQREFGYNISSGGGFVWSGLKHSEESKQKMSKTKKLNPKPVSEERRRKLSKKHSGKNNPMYGKSGANSPVSRRIICLDNLNIYDCIAEAGRKLGINISHISAVCKNKLNKTGGYRFMYIEDYQELQIKNNEEK